MKKVISAISLLMVTGLVQAEQPNVRTVTETFKDWQINCVERSGKKQCEMKQVLINQQQQAVAVISLAKSSLSQKTLQIALPHMLDLTKPVSVSVDGGAPENIQYSFCNQAACFVQVKNNPKLINKMKKGNKLNLKVKPISGKSIQLTASLNGFSGAYTSLKVNP